MKEIFLNFDILDFEEKKEVASIIIDLMSQKFSEPNPVVDKVDIFKDEIVNYLVRSYLILSDFLVTRRRV